MVAKLTQYREIDKLEERGSRRIAIAMSRYRGRVIAALRSHTDISNISILQDLVPITIAASITAHLKGSKRSLLQAKKDILGNNLGQQPQKLPELILAQTAGGPTKKIKRIVKRPVKNFLKREAKKIASEVIQEAYGERGQEILAKAKEAARLAKEGKKLKEKIQADETLREESEYSKRTGTKEFKGKEYKYRKKLKKRKQFEFPRPVSTYKKHDIRPVPSPRLRYKNRKKTARQIAEQELNRIKNEFEDKLIREKKRLYDELVRQARQLAVEAANQIDWQEVLSRLAGNEDKVKILKEGAIEKLKQSILSKLERKINAKLNRFVGESGAEIIKKSFNVKAWISEFNIKEVYPEILQILSEKGELQDKLKKEVKKAVREQIFKPIKQIVEPPIEDLIFGKIRAPGSHRQYRGTYYHIAKTVQELERGQRRRRRIEIAEIIYDSIVKSAELIAFLRKYSIADIFTFIAEFGGAQYFPETAKIGGVIKAVNWLGEVARLLNLREVNEDEDEEQYLSVKEYHIERALKLTQELETLRKLFTRYYPQVFNILDDASSKVNGNLRLVINNLILEGVHINEAKKVLAEAFKANRIAPKNNQQIETLYRTQTQLAFSAGRWQTDQHPAIQEILWGYKYVTVGDNRVRKEHRLLDGVTLPKDHPFWKYFWPPNGWGCRCTVISLFEQHAWITPERPVEIDPSFTFNPGMIFTDASAKLV